MKGKLKKYIVMTGIVSVLAALTIFSILMIGITETINGISSEANKEGGEIQIDGWIDGDSAEFEIGGVIEISGLKAPENVEVSDGTVKLAYDKEGDQVQIDSVTSVDLTGKIEGGTCSFEGKINGINVTATGTVTVKNGRVLIKASGWWENTYFGSSSYKGGKMAWPAPKGTVVTSPFGYRSDPFDGTTAFHSGIDLAGAGVHGTPIIAADDGKVISSGWNGGYGNCVIVDHGGGYSTLYAHASSLIAKAGQSVKKGQTIALVGTTGYSTGPHLHFEVRINGEYQDPYPYIVGDEKQ